MEDPNYRQNLKSVSHGDRNLSALIFLGTGCSSTVPKFLCLISSSHPSCPVCSQSLTLPPEKNPNYRCSTSLLIDFCKSDGSRSYILIDAGKTFREQVLRWFTFHKIPRVDSILLTHEHADAVHGLDDVRAIQPHDNTHAAVPTPVYLSEFTMNSVAARFPYLVNKKLKEGQEKRHVAQLDWNIIEENCEKPFVASGLPVIPLPVMHGENYICLGFLFGERSKVAYISDVSRIPAVTEHVISKSGAGQLDLLILDSSSIRGYSSRSNHFDLPKALEAVKRLCPKRALFVGMTHDYNHNEINEYLNEWSKREAIFVQLARDGLRISIDL